MADKDALHALQTRLAERMEQVRSDQPGRSWLAVRCGGMGVLLPLSQAGEIFEPAAIVSVPHTQPWFIGVVNHRGAICTVVDFACWLGLSEADARLRRAEHHRLVGLNPALGVNGALSIDRLDGLRHESEMTLVDPPPDGAPARPDFAARRWRDVDGGQWQEVDLVELARNAQFLTVAG